MSRFFSLFLIYRASQKRRHILTELEKKKQSGDRKAQTIANVDPNATDRQRLLQLDPTVVGSASDTLGSPKDFTHEQQGSSFRNNNNNREYQGGPPPAIPSKDNRPPYDDTSYQRSNRDRTNVPYENQPRFSPSQTRYDRSDMIPLQEQQPRVVFSTIRSDPNQQYDDSSTSYVPIPVQVERSGPHQRFVPPPYHSDPYYRHTNA